MSEKLLTIYQGAKLNLWVRYFNVFLRVGLAWGFLPSGIVKIMGERFTSLSVNHPMGAYLEALHNTGFYYPFIGIVQIIAAILLLIPRTTTLGALLYLPIILNICILSLAVRFDGSLLTSPLMVLACIYLILWDFDKVKYLFAKSLTPDKPLDKKFPWTFFSITAATLLSAGFILYHLFEIRPRNTVADCNSQCTESKNPFVCQQFCDCIHLQGSPLDECLERYEASKLNGF